MNQQHLHWIEKVQVQIATALAIVLVYFLVWPLVAPSDPAGPVAFFATGSYGRGLVFAGLLVALAALCSAATFTGRPEGALLAAAFGAGGICLRSPQIRALLWTRSGQFGTVYAQMALELLVLGVAVFVAILAAAYVRRLLASANSRWSWSPPIVDSTGRRGVPPSPVDPYLRRLFAAGGQPHGQQSREPRAVRTARAVGCVGLSLVLGMLLLVILEQSAKRGQILFALVAGFALSALAAHQVFPMRRGTVLWLVPVAAGVIFYALAWNGLPAGAADWSTMPLYARTLPVDWVAAGGGGAMLGYWMSERIHEVRHLERHAAAETER